MSAESNLHFLRAEHGDAFILSVKEGERETNVVIDSGPKQAYMTVTKEWEKLKSIDLLVITHFDEDHSGVLSDYLVRKPAFADKVKKFWLNCPGVIPCDKKNTVAGTDDCKTLKDFFCDMEKKGKAYDWRDKVLCGTKYVDDNGLVCLHVIAPNEETKECFAKEYIKRTQDNTIVASSTTVDEAMKKSLEELNILPSPSTEQTVNGSSISFILETADGRRFLFLGDVTEKQVIDYLTSQGYSEKNKLKVDYVKMPHHGSNKNISEHLLNLIECNHYIISTNGGRGNTKHPDRQTIAKILLHETPGEREHITLHFNYTLEEMEKKGTRFLKWEEIDDKRYNFRIETHNELLQI